MPYVKEASYRALPFVPHAPLGDFYTLVHVTELAGSESEPLAQLVRCRAIGVLHSRDGQYYLKNIDRHDNNIRCEVLVSVEFLPQPPQPAIVPYSVQIFGSLNWIDRKAVIYAKVIQSLSHSLALKMNDAVNLVTRTHLALEEAKTVCLDYSVSNDSSVKLTSETSSNKPKNYDPLNRPKCDALQEKYEATKSDNICEMIETKL